VSSGEPEDVAGCEGKGLVTEEINMIGYSSLESRKDIMGGEIVIEAMTKFLFEQLSNAEETPSQGDLEVVR
jgi:hypothetical protein